MGSKIQATANIWDLCVPKTLHTHCLDSPGRPYEAGPYCPHGEEDDSSPQAHSRERTLEVGAGWQGFWPQTMDSPGPGRNKSHRRFLKADTLLVRNCLTFNTRVNTRTPPAGAL